MEVNSGSLISFSSRLRKPLEMEKRILEMKVLWCLKGCLGQAALQMKKLRPKEDKGFIQYHFIYKHIL